MGDQLLRLYRKDQLEYKIVGILDDDPVKHRMLMHGMEVYGGADELEACIKKLDVKAIIIASVKIEKDRINEILDIASRYEVSVKIVPSLFEIEEDQVNATDLRDINVNDLLGRAPS